jgi:hypothetical protein
VIIMNRRATPARLEKELVLDQTVAFGTPLPLPASGGADWPILWAEIQTRQRWEGKLLDQLYKPPLLTLTVRTRSEDLRAFRLLPENAAAGFILQPMPEGPELLQKLMELTATSSAPPPAASPLSISIRGAGNADVSAYYQPQARIKLYRMRLR